MDCQLYTDETEESYCVWRTFFLGKDEVSAPIRWTCSACGQDGAWDRDYEEHRERAWSAEELTAFLTDAGFENINITGDLTRPAAQERRRTGGSSAAGSP